MNPETKSYFQRLCARCGHSRGWHLANHNVETMSIASIDKFVGACIHPNCAAKCQGFQEKE
jgi:hypothetical protein